jgi:hypothetical protein
MIYPFSITITSVLENQIDFLHLHKMPQNINLSLQFLRALTYEDILLH